LDRSRSDIIGETDGIANGEVGWHKEVLKIGAEEQQCGWIDLLLGYSGSYRSELADHLRSNYEIDRSDTEPGHCHPHRIEDSRSEPTVWCASQCEEGREAEENDRAFFCKESECEEARGDQLSLEVRSTSAQTSEARASPQEGVEGTKAEQRTEAIGRSRNPSNRLATGWVKRKQECPGCGDYSGTGVAPEKAPECSHGRDVESDTEEVSGAGVWTKLVGEPEPQNEDGTVIAGLADRWVVGPDMLCPSRYKFAWMAHIDVLSNLGVVVPDPVKT